MSDEKPSLNTWPLWVRLERQITMSRGWESENWRVAEVAMEPDAHESFHRLWLQLYRDERVAYRFNLDSGSPRLFVVCEALETGWVPRKLTICQDVAADYMDGSQPVLSIPMPEAIMLWAERFIAGHGDLPDPASHKRRMRQQKKAAEQGVSGHE
ncbi:DUF3305 domain-containing protein [Nitrincola alkalilacustris]|uniref:DUF3305 domain-containing protein n=1 Tax=Nitrincola alkalilacustris TaxID=1571224 RepID=UPI00124F56D0|nr:DUF3305 domain-containing protein [Nitrincola alkalilacustris]